MKKYTIAELQQMRESEDHVEFKKGEQGNVSYNGGDKIKPKDRRKCILGYVTALCNEGGGRMVIGMHDDHPHRVTGTKQSENALGELESNIYRDTKVMLEYRNTESQIHFLLEDKKLTVFDVMVLCEIRDGKRMPSNKQIARKLEQMGIIEKHGKTNAIYYILPRRYYELSGDTAAYSAATDWDIDQVWSVVQPFLEKYQRTKRADLDKLVNGHVTEKQMRRFLDAYRDKGWITTEGKRNYMYYVLAKGEENGEETA